MQKITPFLWFDDQAEEAVRFYLSVFPRSKILKTVRYGGTAAKASGRRKGEVMTIKFRLDGMEFVALNGGPHFKFNEAVSFVVNCKTQREVDRYWQALSKGGHEGRCGWLKDRFGVSWQIVPTGLVEVISGKDAAAAERVMSAVMTMGKLNLKTLRRAALPPK